MASGYQSCRILDSMSIYQDSAMSLAQFQEQPNYRTIAELLRGRAHGMIGTMTEEELARHGPDVLGLLDSSANIANQIGQPHMAVAIDGLKSEFYLRIGECDTAFTIYKEYVERSKELLSVGKYLPILQEASLFRVREMELEHQIETRDKKRKVIWLSSLVIVFGALLLMFAFQWITQDDRRKAWMKSALMIVVLMIYEMIVLYIVNTDVFASVEHGSFYLSVLLLLIVAWLLHHLRQEVEGWINNPPRFRKRSAGYGT